MQQPMQIQTGLATIKELPSITVDACILDPAGQVTFLSCWGRDTAMSELIARLTLDSGEESLRSGITLVMSSGASCRVGFNTTLLEKQLSRNYRGTLFGCINHLWLYDRRTVSPDYANLTSKIMLEQHSNITELEQHPQFQRCLSQLISISPVPILPSWAARVFAEIKDQDMVIQHTTLLGQVLCIELSLDAFRLETAISSLIRSGELTLPDAQNHAA